MGRYKISQTTETLAVGIEANRHSLCGAIKRFQRKEFQWNGLLTLKEQCARRIARIKNEQIKWYISSWLPPELFKYATKDIFDLQRAEFVSNYPEEYYMCEHCSMDTYERRPAKCRCPKMDRAINHLNKHLFELSTTENTKHFELIYKRPTDEDMYEEEEEEDGASCFLYLSPVHHRVKIDEMNINYDDAYDEYKTIHGEISVEDKLLFVHAVRLLGGFRIEQKEPQLILYRRHEFKL